MADWQLGSTVYDHSVVEIVILEAVVIVICGLGGSEPLRLGELDGIVLQLLEGHVVELVEVEVVEVIHLSIGPVVSVRVRDGEL